MKELKNARIWSNKEMKKIAEIFEGDIINISGEFDNDKQGGYIADILSMRRHTGYLIINY